MYRIKFWRYQTLAVALVALLTACSGRTCDSGYYEYYPEDLDMSADIAEMSAPPQCVLDADCPARSNASAGCVNNACEYSCADGWGDPSNERQTNGCLCDKTKASCSPVAICGDGFKEGMEQCDDGTSNNDEEADACRSSCKTAYCGDAVKDTGELCDDGNEVETDDCTSACTLCGNGKLDPGEECDDGQVPPKDHDGCSSTCLREAYFGCSETLPHECWQELADPDSRNLVPFESIRNVGLPNMVAQGDELFVGMPYMGDGVDDSSGRVTVFKKDPITGVWAWSYRLKASEEQPGALFGISLAINGEWLMVGSPGFNNMGSEGAGRVYVYRRQGGEWKEFQRISPTDKAYEPYTAFGYGVDIKGSVMVVTAPGAKGFYVYDFKDLVWSKRPFFSAPETMFNNFGYFVGFNGEYVMAGSTFCSDHRGRVGCIVIYNVELGTYETIYSPSYGGSLNNNFGGEFFFSEYGLFALKDSVEDLDTRSYFMDYSGDILQTFKDSEGQVSYAVGDNLFLRGDNKIIVYKYLQGFWNKGAQTLTINSPRIVNSEFGSGFATNGEELFVGARRYSSTYQDSGAIFVFNLDEL